MQNLQYCSTNNKGISLVEIIVVVAIISIIAFMAGPEMLNIGPRAKMKTAARDLKSNLELARIEATKRNRSIYAIFTPGNCADYSEGGSYELVIDTDKNGVDTSDPRLTLVGKNTDKKYQFESGTALCAKGFLVGAGEKELRFNGRGLVVNKDGQPLSVMDEDGQAKLPQITISSRYKKGTMHPAYTISISPTGNMSIKLDDKM